MHSGWSSTKAARTEETATEATSLAPGVSTADGDIITQSDWTQAHTGVSDVTTNSDVTRDVTTDSDVTISNDVTIDITTNSDVTIHSDVTRDVTTYSDVTIDSDITTAENAAVWSSVASYWSSLLTILVVMWMKY